MTETVHKRKGKHKNREYQAYIYLLPWLLGFCILQLYPFLNSLFYSFTDYKIAGNADFVGLGNYIKLLTADNEFWNSLKLP